MNPLDSAPRFETQESAPVCRAEGGAGVNTPLYVCVDVALPRKGDPKKSSREWNIEKETGYEAKDVTTVQYLGAPSTLRAKGMRLLTHKYRHTDYRKAVCVFSAIDETPKKSGVNDLQSAYYRCTGIVASGVRKQDGVRVSVMSHNDPDFYLSEREREFDSMLRDVLRTLRETCDEGTIDLAIVGGQPKDNVYTHHRDQRLNRYDASVSMIAEASRDVLGISPLVVGLAVPRGGYDTTEVFLDTAKNRLYTLARPDRRREKPDSVEGNVSVERLPEDFKPQSR